MKKVENKRHRFGQTDSYWHDQHEGVDYLFTEDQMTKARERATTNPEDVPSTLHEKVLARREWIFWLIVGAVIGSIFSHINW